MQDGLHQENYSKSDDNIFHDIIGRYLPFWPLFASLFVVGILGAVIYLRYATPIYEANASLIIKDQKQGLPEGSLLESFDLFGSQKVLENEIEVIRSRSIAKEVVKKLHLYAPVMKEGRINDISAYTISPVEIEVQDIDSIQDSEEIYFKYKADSNIVTLDDRSYALRQWINLPQATIRFVSNPQYVYDSTNARNPLYFKLQNTKAAVKQLLEQLNVAPGGKQSSVIELTYSDEVPRRAENILNELITAYNRASINDKNQLAANTLSFVENRLAFVVGELDSVEHNLAKFKTNNRIVDISEQGRQFLESVGTNDQKMGELSMQLAILEQVENYVKSKNQSGAIVPSTVGITDVVLSRLLETLYVQEAQYEKLRATTAENNALIITARDQIDKLRSDILENIQNQKFSIQAGIKNVNSTANRYASMLQTLPLKERQLLDISRQQNIKSTIYTFLLQKREEAALSYASAVSDSRIIDIAESTEKPVSPRKLFVLAIVVALAFAIGIGFVEGKYLLNRNVSSREEVEKYTHFPIVGEIALSADETDLVVAEGKRSFIAEQFRQLRTSLNYLGIGSRKKKILITSSISGEGKSFISANLGVSLALAGKKVVLIELDLRKPKLSDLFNVSRNIGVSNYLVGDKECEDIIKSTHAANLFIISSGPVPPNPSELILNGRLKELLNYLELHFDYILIDSAPISPVTDAFIISPMCDASLFIVRESYTPRFLLQKLEEQNRIKGFKNLAVVYNGVKKATAGNYGNYAAYGYGYVEDLPQKKKGKLKKEKLS